MTAADTAELARLREECERREREVILQLEANNALRRLNQTLNEDNLILRSENRRLAEALVKEVIIEEGA